MSGPSVSEKAIRKSTDVRVVGATVFFLPVATRTPLKFGRETLTSVTCCRVKLTVADAKNRQATGWGETPLSVQWAWPADLPYGVRHESMQRFAVRLAETWAANTAYGHPIELAADFHDEAFDRLLSEHNADAGTAAMPHLAALICWSALDIALHDAYAKLHGVDVYDTYTAEFMSRDLAAYLTPAEGSDVDFRDKFPRDYLVDDPPKRLPVWHLVGGLDPLTPADAANMELAKDGYPSLLNDWIRADGLQCLKVKLRGNDAAWDYDRLVRVAAIALPLGVTALSADFNCTVSEPTYVNELLDRLAAEHPEVLEKILYVEQPFPYDLEANQIDVRSITERKPIFLDESAHDWRYVRLGRSLGWTGVCLKTCKTQSGTLLSHSWARAHGMSIMVQDLTNPMLAQIPHVRLAAHVGTIMGVESNGMQFYPEASRPEAVIHPGIYKRRNGQLDLSTISGPGFGYRIDEIHRELPPPAAAYI